MQRIETLKEALDGPILLKPVVHDDDRGFFLEAFRADWSQEAGVDLSFVQDNHSRSYHGVLRGMHFQPGQAKLVRCAHGRIFDVVVDVRAASPTFAHWAGYELDDQAHHELYVPDGFAHGFCVISHLADVIYKVSSYYDPTAERGFRFDDGAVGIDWPLSREEMIVSERDRSAPTLAQVTAS